MKVEYTLIYRDDLGEVYIRTLSSLSAWLQWRDENPHCMTISFERK